MSDKRLNPKFIKEGTRVRRIDGDGDQKDDVGREGVVQTPNRYNIIAGNMTVKYNKTDLLSEKIDDCCSPFEFETL